VANGYLVAAEMADARGRQLPVIQYPDLSRDEIVAAVQDFYRRYYYRPRIIFRILRGAMGNSDDRRRIMKEGREFLGFRSQSRKNIRSLKENS